MIEKMSGLIRKNSSRKQRLRNVPRHRIAFYAFHVVAAASIILFTLLL
ncbi:MAG: hypothetical protein KC483_07735 [Nitrosarchaeum sp.]|nr:hypothetical protein [Nitrosarchaeum sp.]